jgi:hypothetical protein
MDPNIRIISNVVAGVYYENMALPLLYDSLLLSKLRPKEQLFWRLKAESTF